MFAVIQTGGKQYLVQSGQRLSVEKLAAEAGESINFDQVLCVGSEDGTVMNVGNPYLEGVSIPAKVEEQTRGKKLRVVKSKRKVRYKKVYGHRQAQTIVTIGEIKA